MTVSYRFSALCTGVLDLRVCIPSELTRRATETDSLKVNKFGGGYHSWEISAGDFENYLKVKLKFMTELDVYWQACTNT